MLLQPLPDPPSLFEAVRQAREPGERHLMAPGRQVSLAEIARSTILERPQVAAGRRVLVSTGSQLAAALAMIGLDGRASLMLLAPPDIAREHLPALMKTAAIDLVVTDRVGDDCSGCGECEVVACLPTPRPFAHPAEAARATDWVLATSGTTGTPKLVAHSLAALSGAIRSAPAPGDDTVWATFYDIRRYGGLQIFLRAILGGTSLVLSYENESPSDHLVRLAEAGATHITGTPSHWRRALMSPEVSRLSPRYVRLSGEIADQPTLDMLREAFPQARIGHAYASTEAGVAFEVDDGKAGFPASYIGKRGNVEMKVACGTLRIRSDRTATRYLGDAAPALHDADGFVDTGDIVELGGDRYVFSGRRGGIINVGGQKVHPEEIEAVVNEHPRVRMSLARAQRNPLTGAIVVADVVAAEGVCDNDHVHLSEEIAELCRSRLARHKVPVIIRFVPTLPMTAGGKLRRSNA